MKHVPFADPGTPDLRGPLHYLWWIGWRSRGTVAITIAISVVWMLGRAFIPAVIGIALDQGVLAGDTAALMQWSLVLLGLVVWQGLGGSFTHWWEVRCWLDGALGTAQLVGRHSAAAGPAVARRLPTGEVTATVSNDAFRIGNVWEGISQLVTAIVAYVVVAMILLSRSITLGLIVLIGVPILIGALSFILKPLQTRQAAQREAAGRLLTIGTDTATGLRVLRGIGGETAFVRRYTEQSQLVRRRGHEVASVQATLDTAQVLLPGVFLVGVLAIGVHLVRTGELTPGDLVAFAGYSTFIMSPLRNATAFIDHVIRGRVAAKKVIAVLSVPADDHEHVPSADAPQGQATLHDPVTGAVIRPGALTLVVSARPEDGAELADRLGRLGGEPTPVRWGGAPLADMPLAQVRSRIVVAHNEARLFTGLLRDELDVAGGHDDDHIREALEAASATDVLDGLPEGLDTEVTEQGRAFSGGQRQRLALTRALLTDADVLVLVEPTSAVDAHTEARIAQRLSAYRDGRTTIVSSVSPLLLDAADDVVFLRPGQPARSGSHADLLADPDYRRVVLRGDDDPDNDSENDNDADSPAGDTAPTPHDAVTKEAGQ